MELIRAPITAAGGGGGGGGGRKKKGEGLISTGGIYSTHCGVKKGDEAETGGGVKKMGLEEKGGMKRWGWRRKVE